MRKQSGYTLAELCVVIAFLAGCGIAVLVITALIKYIVS